MKSFLTFVNEMTHRDISKELYAAGYEPHRNGRHPIWKHKVRGDTVPVPAHSGDIPTGTARSILKTIGSHRRI